MSGLCSTYGVFCFCWMDCPLFMLTGTRRIQQKCDSVCVWRIKKNSPFVLPTFTNDKWLRKPVSSENALNNRHSCNAVHFFVTWKIYPKASWKHIAYVQYSVQICLLRIKLAPIGSRQSLFCYSTIILLIIAYCLHLFSFLCFFIGVCYSPLWENSNLSCRSEKKKMANFYVNFMVTICTILKVLILVYIQISVFQHVRKMLQHHTYILWTLYCCFMMCFNLRSGQTLK